MGHAFELAERGRYSVSPNPMVGAVLVRGGRIVGEGFHRRAGEAHAEIVALECAGGRARGADLYVTLEPCTHFGRTPPCVDALKEAGVRRVIVAARDPNPRVSGRGFSVLSRAGIEVLDAGVDWRGRAERQNEKFFVWTKEGRPFVLAKWAATLDGKLASASGESRWITGREARRRALLLREEHDAILVGAGTVAADDPKLTRRLGRGRRALFRRIVLDGRLRIPADARLLRKPEGVIVVTAASVAHPKVRLLAARGAEVWSIPSGRRGQVDLRRLLDRLGRAEVTSLVIEGGAETLWSFLAAGLVDRVGVFVAPRILGGRAAVGAVGGAGFALSQTPGLTDVECERLGKDFFLTGRVAAPRRGSRRPRRGRAEKA
jgi:diaminohydroxyphosphoribosylaminopyrimidine deaminase/5-amino-6-(5-phosphoribosylamino)uracil reductase